MACCKFHAWKHPSDAISKATHHWSGKLQASFNPADTALQLSNNLLTPAWVLLHANGLYWWRTTLFLMLFREFRTGYLSFSSPSKTVHQNPALTIQDYYPHDNSYFQAGNKTTWKYKMVLEIILEFLAGMKHLEEPVFMIAWHQKDSYRLGTVFLNAIFLDAQTSL